MKQWLRPVDGQGEWMTRKPERITISAKYARWNLSSHQPNLRVDRTERPSRRGASGEGYKHGRRIDDGLAREQDEAVFRQERL